MYKLLEFNLKPSHQRLGTCKVEYHGLVLKCDIVLYKFERMWIRMPELWIKPNYKKCFVRWNDKKQSDDFQTNVLLQLHQKTKLTLKDAVKMKKDYFEKAKKSDKNKKRF